MTIAIPALNESEIRQGLSKLPGWDVVSEASDSTSIRKIYKFDSYPAGLAFASAVGIIAEGKNHHPDILIGWRQVTLTFTTHDAGSKITHLDLEIAAVVESLGFPRPKET